MRCDKHVKNAENHTTLKHKLRILLIIYIIHKIKRGSSRSVVADVLNLDIESTLVRTLVTLMRLLFDKYHWES